MKKRFSYALMICCVGSHDPHVNVADNVVIRHFPYRVDGKVSGQGLQAGPGLLSRPVRLPESGIHQDHGSKSPCEGVSLETR